MFGIPGTEDAYGSMQRGRLLHPALGGVQWAPMATRESGTGCGVMRMQWHTLGHCTHEGTQHEQWNSVSNLAFVFCPEA